MEAVPRVQEGGEEMSYWSDHPELYDKIIIDEAIRKGVITEEEREEKSDGELVQKLLQLSSIFTKIALDAEANYWGGQIYAAIMRRGENEDGNK